MSKHKYSNENLEYNLKKHPRRHEFMNNVGGVLPEAIINHGALCISTSIEVDHNAIRKKIEERKKLGKAWGLNLAYDDLVAKQTEAMAAHDKNKLKKPRGDFIKIRKDLGIRCQMGRITLNQGPAFVKLEMLSESVVKKFTTRSQKSTNNSFNSSMSTPLSSSTSTVPNSTPTIKREFSCEKIKKSAAKSVVRQKVTILNRKREEPPTKTENRNETKIPKLIIKTDSSGEKYSSQKVSDPPPIRKSSPEVGEIEDLDVLDLMVYDNEFD